METSSRSRIDLDGAWDLAFDEPEGPTRLDWIGDGWPAESSDSVTVPAIWNLTHPDAPAIGYYRRAFDVPATWSNQRMRLHVDGACYRLEAWVNGAYVGSHQGAYTGFWFDVSAAIHPGQANDVVFRVTALRRDRTVDGMNLYEMPVSKQSWYHVEGGVWGSVWIEALAAVSIESVAIEPDLRRSVASFEVSFTNATPESAHQVLQIDITDPNGLTTVAHSDPVVIQPGSSRYFVKLPIERSLAWSPTEPHLYTARIAITESRHETDRQTTTFGMRDFTVKDGQFYLNGDAIFIRGILMQPNYPAGLLAPLDLGMLETEVRLMKEAGFNMMRVHIRPPVPGFLDLTDRLGMLVYEESSLAWLRESPRLLDHARREITAMIERDRNHPSVVFWGVFNEHRHPAGRYADTLIRTVRALDNTRVVVDNSGGAFAIDQDFGWIDRATVVPDRSTTRESIQDIHIYAGAPIAKRAFDWLASIGSPFQSFDVDALGIGSDRVFDEWSREVRDDPGQIFVSELGCGGMGDLDAMLAGFAGKTDLVDAREYRAFRDSLHEGFAERHLDQLFGSIDELVRQAQHQQRMGNRRQIEAMLINRRVSGYSITQLADVGSEFHAGILDLWRKPKPVYDEIRRLQQPRTIVLDLESRAVQSGTAARVEPWVIDQFHASERDTLQITITDSAGRVRAEHAPQIPAGQGIKPLPRFTIETGGMPGWWRVAARLASDPAVVCEEELLLLAPVQAEIEPNSTILDATRPSSLTRDAWQRFFEGVREGRTGIVGDLAPGDELALAMLAEAGIDAQLTMGIGSWLGCYHWTTDSPLFTGLPAGGLAGEVYAGIVPRYVLPEHGGQLLAGSISNTQTRVTAPAMTWHADVEVVPHGDGQIIFCQYRIFDDDLADPVGLTLRQNLLTFASNLKRTAT
jgi:hypothetical protein